MNGAETLEKNALASWWESVLQTLKSFGAKDVIDILLFAGLLFAFVILFAKSRHRKAVLGAVVFAGGLWVCSLFGLTLMGGIARAAWSVSLILLVVLFQPEWRDLLEKIGSFPFRLRDISGKKDTVKGVSEAVNTISEAVCAMSQEKTGALIVIERRVPLKDFITNAVELDAKLSEELLRNIFINKSALHDGAVVIRHFRVASATGVLPVANDAVAFGDMGTRHRAALGISKVTDAVVVVVSEETGIISIANNGIIKRGYHSGTIKEDLYALLAGNPADEIAREYLDIEEEK